MTTTTSIINTLAEDVAQRLKDELMTATTDDAKASAVQAGNLKGLTNIAPITVMVHTGDEFWRHTSNMSSQNVGMQDTFGSIGGGLNERLRYFVEYEMVFDASFTQEEARQIANVVVSHTRWALSNKRVEDGLWWFSLEPDSFGEQASRVFVYDTYLVEGGSEGKWKWRGITRIEFLTEREGCI